jgi:hypothetical protein
METKSRIEKIEDILLEIGDESHSIYNAAKRLLLGDVITLNYKKQEAYINYYVGDNTEKVRWLNALILTSYNFIEYDSGNLETKEDHYRSSLVLKNEEELRSTKNVIKYKL